MPQRKDDDDGLWQKVMHSVTPMKSDRHVTSLPPQSRPKQPAPPPPAPKQSKLKQAQAITVVPSPVVLRPINLDKGERHGISDADAKKLETGTVALSARTDLHGLNVNEALRRLKLFIADAKHAGHRRVLVITGKGQGGNGILRQSLPKWLNTPPLSEQVVAFCQAKPKDGGGGAWYLQLRRDRPSRAKN